jgi:cytochrome c peroxidase
VESVHALGAVRLLAFVATVSLPITIPLGLDLYLPVPGSNPLTVEKIDAGRRLFSDRRLSRDQSIACSSCHDPDRSFAGTRARSVGVFGRRGMRNVPALINRAYGRAFFWDGRVTTLEAQVLQPLENPDEMDLPAADAAARVGLDVHGLSHALASYVRSILSGNSAFDRFRHGDRTALTPPARRGFEVFRQSGCPACHIPPTFTDERFHNTGVAWRPPGLFADDGRFVVTRNDADRGAFKTPTLRDVVRTAPYMHDGSLATLEDVVEFYDAGGRSNPHLDPEMRRLGLAPQQKRDLVAFLRSLTGTVQQGVGSRPPSR